MTLAILFARVNPRRWRKIAFAAFAAMAMPLMADEVTVLGSAGGSMGSLGVDFEVTVFPNGSVGYALSQLSDTATWTLGLGLDFSGLPAGSTINSATFFFSAPNISLSPEGGAPQLTGTASISLASAGFTESGCPSTSAPNFPTFGGSPANSMSIQFMPCASSFDLDTVFTGTASVDLTSWNIPTTPGTYENALLAFDNIDYGVTVDYTPPVPEPSFLALTALGILGILSIGIRRKNRMARGNSQ
jgi:hypothetical protein